MKNNTINRKKTINSNLKLPAAAKSFLQSFRLFFTVLLLLMGSSSFASIWTYGVTGTCGSLCEGSFIVAVNGTAGPFTASIEGQPEPTVYENNGITSFVFQNLCADISYMAEVENAYMCVTTITQYIPIDVGDLEITGDVSCICPNGGYGVVEAMISGGVQPYTYEWYYIDQLMVGENNPTLDLLTEEGDYTLLVTDANGCKDFKPFYLSQCSGDLYNATFSHSCDGPGTGNISVDIIENVPPPTIFYWTKDGVPFADITNDQTNGQTMAENLEAGEYCLTIFTDNGCSAQECWTIIESQGIESIQIAVQASVGLIVLYDDNGIVFGNQYTYEWTGPNGFESNAALFNTTQTGIYSIIISYPDADNNPCERHLSAELFSCAELEDMANLDTDSPDFPLSAEVFVSDNQKTIDLSINNLENYNFNYVWTSNGNPVGYSQDLVTNESGEFCITATDRSCGVPFELCVTICDFGVKLFETPMQPVACDGVNMQAYPYDGSGNYSYQWNNAAGSTGNIIIMEYNQEYCVTVTDLDFDCSMISCLTIPHEPLSVTYSVGNATLGFANGAIDLNPTGGFPSSLPNPAYTYDWSDPTLSGQNVAGLSGGDYSVTITDNCQNEQVLNIYVDCLIPQQTVFNCTNANITPVTCGGALGSIEINVTCINAALGLPSGTTYLYQWDNGLTSSFIDGLPVGTYCVTIIENQSNCAVNACFEVPQANIAKFDMAINVLQHTCYGGDDAILQATINDDPEQYTYEWTTYAPNEDGVYEIQPFGNTATVEGVSAGWYTVYVTDINTGCQGFYQYLYWSSGSVIDVVGSMTPDPNCDGEPTVLTADATGGEGPYSYEWTASYPLQSIGTTTVNNFTVTNLGNYFVTVTDVNGCIGSEAFDVNQKSPMSLNGEITNTCTEGTIYLTVSGGNVPYTAQWDNGATTIFNTGLSAGTYCVTVTDVDGCTTDDCYTIMPLMLDITDVTIVDNDCASNCNGSIDIEVSSSNPVSYLWSNGATTEDIEGLCVGDYTVTVSSEGCEVAKGYLVGGEEEGDFVYEVEIVRHFFANNSNGSAHVVIYSDDFAPNSSDSYVTLYAEGVGSLSTDNVNAANGSHPMRYVEFYITIDWEHISNFYFTYTLGDCQYTGQIGHIDTCVDDENFSYSYELIEADDLPCGSVEFYSYEFNINEINPPYFIEVYMENAYDSNYDNFYKKVEYEGPNFILEDIPAGIVDFRIKDKCKNSYGFIDTHSNCCGFTCEIISEEHLQNALNGGNYYYQIPYFRLENQKLCFDECGNWDQWDCSFLHVNPQFVTSCWTGTVTVEYPGNDSQPDPDNTVIFEIDEDGDITKISGNDKWFPNNEGDYLISVKYAGTGGAESCEILNIPLKWYGKDNYSDMIGFNNDFWFNPNSMFDNYPEDFNDAYFGAWRCEDCGEGTPFVYENNQGECEDFANWQFTYFHFTPDNNNYDDPCNSPGTITIMDFDANGNATIVNVPVTGTAIAEFPGVQPFGQSPDTYCTNSGWCLFEALDVYNGTLLPNNISIIASWFDENSCETLPPFDDPFSDPLCEAPEDCPLGYICINGNCYEECDDGECFSGECGELEGYEVCLPGSSCNPPCPNEDYTCINGQCYLDEICSFSATVSGGGGDTYTFAPGLEVGTVLTLGYNTFYVKDRIEVSGVSGMTSIDCIGGNIGWQYKQYTVTSSANPIVIQVIPCAQPTTYALSLTCEYPSPQFSTINTNLTNTEATIDPLKLSINPNPFQNTFELEVNTEKEGNVKIEIFNLLGNNFLREDAEVFEGKNKFNYELGLPVGVYQVVVTDEEGHISTQRIVKANQ